MPSVYCSMIPRKLPLLFSVPQNLSHRAPVGRIFADKLAAQVAQQTRRAMHWAVEIEMHLPRARRVRLIYVKKMEHARAAPALVETTCRVAVLGEAAREIFTACE